MEVKRRIGDGPAGFATALGVTLHPGQVRWLEARSPVKVAACGRRWGKSYAEAVDLLYFAALHRGSSQFLIAPTYDQVSTIFNYAVSLVTSSEVFAPFVDQVVRSPFPELQVFGSSIGARSTGNEGKNIRSKGADRIIYDEAAFIPETARAAIAPLLANSSIAEQVYISSPWGKNYFWDLFIQGQRREFGYTSFQFPSWTSPYVSRAYLAKQKRELTTLEFAVEYGAEFSEDQATVFKWELIRACLDTDLTVPDPPPHGRRYIIGFDPAKWVDRSGVVVLDATTIPWQAVEVRDIGGRDYLAQAPVLKDLATRYSGARVLMDSTSHDQMLESLQRDHVSVEGFQFTNASKQELINGLVIAMEQDRVRIPNHPDLLKELSYYRFELTAAGNVRLGAPEKAGHHDDLVTALALAVHQAAKPRMTGNRTAVSAPRPVIASYTPR